MILAVAARAAGVCTRAELVREGVPEPTIGNRVRAGFLARVASGVYEVPALVGPGTGYHRAAKAHPRGAISHLAAARLWGMAVARVAPDEPIVVTVPVGASVRTGVAGVVVRSTRRWIADDLGRPRLGLVATSVARTIVDLAGTPMTGRRLAHLVQTEVVAGRVTLAEVGACLDRVGGRGVAGAGRLARLLAELDDGQPVPDSELERRLSALVDRRRFHSQYRPPWYDGVRGVVDLADPASRVVVEADGRRWHTTAQAMADDRRRDRVAAVNGWVVIRVTWGDVVDRPEEIEAEIAATVNGRC
jgi:very-short-patch-repair endonuclease